jgi:uncharacterized protein (TIGR03067 family)
MVATLAAVLLLAPAADPPKLSEAAQKELKKFEGKWKVTKEITADVEQEPTMNGAEVVVEFKDGKITLLGLEVFKVTALDPGVDPKCIDIKALVQMGVVAAGGEFEAIYKFDGDTLTMAAFLGEGKKRPANFDKPKEAGTCVFVLKRIKD